MHSGLSRNRRICMPHPRSAERIVPTGGWRGSTPDDSRAPGVFPGLPPRTNCSAFSCRPVGKRHSASAAAGRALLWLIRSERYRTPCTSIGAGLHAARELSQRAPRRRPFDERAERCEVSRSRLSLIKRAPSPPAAVGLNQIAASFGAPLADAGPVSCAEEHQSGCDPRTGDLREALSSADRAVAGTD